MSVFLTQALFIAQLGSRLLKFQRKSSNLYNMRCILCGDSQKNKNKARAYLYLQNGKFHYHCHNCNQGMNFERFIRLVDPGLYAEYTMALLDDHSIHSKMVIPPPPKLIPIDNVKGIAKLNDLPRGHPAKTYIENRKIPAHFVSKLYWTDDFRTTTNLIIPNKFENEGPSDPRIIIPFFGQKGEFFGYQGRTINPKSELRYITILIDPNRPKLFGLDKVNFNQRYFVFEGPFDSMFIPNGIATAGGKLVSELRMMNVNLDNAVVVADNEPRNRDVARGIKSAINFGLKVVIWPSNFSFKDVNEAIMAGKTISQIETIIRDNTFSELEADLRFEDWKRV